MRPPCVICGTEFYRETALEPAEPCWCGQMADGSLWGWNRWRAYLDRARYWLAYRLNLLSQWLT
jgi:hypothetical protein